MQGCPASQSRANILLCQNLGGIFCDLIQVLNLNSLSDDTSIRLWVQCVDLGHEDLVHRLGSECPIGHKPQSGVEGVQRWSINAGAVQNGFLGQSDRIRCWIEEFNVSHLQMRFINAVLGNTGHANVNALLMIC